MAAQLTLRTGSGCMVAPYTLPHRRPAIHSYYMQNGAAISRTQTPSQKPTCEAKLMACSVPAAIKAIPFSVHRVHRS